MHVIPDDDPKGRQKTPWFNPLPPPCPHPITIPMPKESTSITHLILSDLQQLINHVKDMRVKYPWEMQLQEQENVVVDPATGKGLEFHHLIQGQEKEIWSTSMANELGRCYQVTEGKTPTYARI
eukprot:6230679-Ditylum_brightwellii.AAC.1